MIDLINKKQRELKLKEGYGLKIAEIIKAKKADTILKGIISHEINQTLNWELEVIEEAKQNSINKGVLYRNNKEDLNLALRNGKTVIIYKGRLLNSKIDEIKSELAKFESDFHSNIIVSLAKEYILASKKYFEENKDKLLQENKEKLEEMINELEKNYAIDETSSSLFALYSNDEDKLEAEIEKIKKYKEEIKKKTKALIELKKSKEESIQEEAIKEFFNAIQNKQKEGNIVDLKDIPLGLGPDNQIKAGKFIEKINKDGFINSNSSSIITIFNSFKVPLKFKKTKLQKYRFNLSSDDFEVIEKFQNEKNITISDIYELANKSLSKIKNEEEKSKTIIKILNDISEEKKLKNRDLNFEEIKKTVMTRVGTDK